MADYNLVVVVGRLARDPELKYTADNGTPYARFGLAVNRQTTLPDGSVQKSVTFVDISVWRHQAEIACQFLKKGSTCLVSGWLEQSRWIDKQGQKRSKLRVRAQRLQFMDRKPAEQLVPAEGGNGTPVEAGADAEPSQDDE